MNDFDEDFEEYLENCRSRMWKGVSIAIIVSITAMLILAIVYK